MRDEQVRRYARHILLPDVGGLGQTALMVSAAHVDLGGLAQLTAATYLAAGGVGTLSVSGADESELATLAAHGPDTTVQSGSSGRPVLLSPQPAWWPSAPRDARALAFWRGGMAAIRWMADVTSR